VEGLKPALAAAIGMVLVWRNFMYSLIWQSVIWRPGKGRIPHWREDIQSLAGRPRLSDGVILTDHTVAALAPLKKRQRPRTSS
jgi:hypothetical protein